MHNGHTCIFNRLNHNDKIQSRVNNENVFLIQHNDKQIQQCIPSLALDLVVLGIIVVP